MEKSSLREARFKLVWILSVPIMVTFMGSSLLIVNLEIHELFLCQSPIMTKDRDICFMLSQTQRTNDDYTGKSNIDCLQNINAD